MSASPSKDAAGDVEHSEENNKNQDPDMDNQDAESKAEGLLVDFDVKEQDRWLPIANVARIMKNALPENAKIAKDAKECMQECVSEFISFITSEASEKCQHEKRKTVNGEDILFAMSSLGFENYTEALKVYLTKYRETLQNRADQQQRDQAQSGQAGPGGQTNNGTPGQGGALPGQYSGAEGGQPMLAGDGAVDYSLGAGDGSHETGF